jgi:hypothetical protein
LHRSTVDIARRIFEHGAKVLLIEQGSQTWADL